MAAHGGGARAAARGGAIATRGGLPAASGDREKVWRVG